MFYELENDLFLGEIDDWLTINDEPPKLVFDFINRICQLHRNEAIYNLTIILTSFAQAGKTLEQVYDISIDEFRCKLFLMSFNSDVSVIDSLILNIK